MFWQLAGEPVVAIFATTKKYGRQEGYTQTVQVDYYNLEMITSIGYRVKSQRGVQFRKWTYSMPVFAKAFIFLHFCNNPFNYLYINEKSVADSSKSATLLSHGDHAVGGALSGADPFYS